MQSSHHTKKLPGVIHRVLLAAAMIVPAMHAKAQMSGGQAATAATTIAQSAGFGPTNFYDGRPDLSRYSIADGRIVFDEHFNTRFEGRENNNDFNSAVNSPTDATWLLTRFRVGALFHATSWLKFYVQGQDIRELGGSRPNNVGTFGADGDDVFDLLQAWVAIGDENHGLSLRAGRQAFNFANQRLLGNPQWKNSTNAWDAVRLRYSASTWAADLFMGSPVTFLNNQWNKSDYFNTHEGRNAVVTGAYFTSSSLIPWQSATDLYLLHQGSSKNTGAPGAPLGAVGYSNFWTVGTMWKGDPKKLHNWDYDLEMALQFGKAAGLNHRAFAGHWGFGYNFSHSWKPRLGFQYNYASGDGNPNDGKSTTFQNMFPGNHALFGFMDTTAWMNMQNPQINFSIQPTEKLKLTCDAMAFFNANNGDAWYGANTTTAVRPVTASAQSASKYRGMEFDINAWYKVNKHVSLQTGYAYFLTGKYLAQTGASDNAHFGYAQMTVNF
ncbi:alginate export family protein [Prosthecobacter sp.]|uniref:alginate export family protein n=1 Tax=Prosthecobacter sp. TaxID=1965333 RepID=UPI001DA5A734|nr:alginate export family protein [Prosthecobacter sp.]MCB1275331.1 alginate export family protein [Prosthecobacter sp.]